MNLRRAGLLLGFVLSCGLLHAEQFAVFPDRKELRSPNGKFVIRSVEHVAARGEFSGIIRWLILEEPATGKSHHLYNYLSRVGVAWSGDNFVIVTDYVSKKTARAMVFDMNHPGEFLVIDKPHLTAQLHEQRREQLEGNDHVYLEVSRLEGSALLLRVWGYGKLDPQGFRFWCAYDLKEGTVSCREKLGEVNDGSSTGTRFGREVLRNYLSEAFSGPLSSRGVIETTLYSRSLSSRSSTRRIILSFCKRNWACSPTGRSTGCFSSRGRIR